MKEKLLKADMKLPQKVITAQPTHVIDRRPVPPRAPERKKTLVVEERNLPDRSIPTCSIDLLTKHDSARQNSTRKEQQSNMRAGKRVTFEN